MPYPLSLFPSLSSYSIVSSLHISSTLSFSSSSSSSSRSPATPATEFQYSILSIPSVSLQLTDIRIFSITVASSVPPIHFSPSFTHLSMPSCTFTRRNLSFSLFNLSPTYSFLTPHLPCSNADPPSFICSNSTFSYLLLSSPKPTVFSPSSSSSSTPITTTIIYSFIDVVYSNISSPSSPEGGALKIPPSFSGSLTVNGGSVNNYLCNTDCGMGGWMYLSVSDVTSSSSSFSSSSLFPITLSAFPFTSTPASFGSHVFILCSSPPLSLLPHSSLPLLHSNHVRCSIHYPSATHLHRSPLLPLRLLRRSTHLHRLSPIESLRCFTLLH